MSGADVPQDIRTYLLADAAVSGKTSRCFVNVVPEAKARPFIWLRRSGAGGTGVVGGADSIWQVRLDLECVAGDLDTASQLADAVRARLEGASGTLGSNSYAWVAVEDQFDDYEIVNQAADEHLESVALNVEVTLP